MAERTRREQRQRDDITWIEAILESAQRRDWYGAISIQVRNGIIDLVECKETLKDGQLGLHGPALECSIRRT